MVSGNPLTNGSTLTGKAWAVAIAGVISVYAACFWPLLLGRHFLYGDLGNMHLPLRLFYAGSFSEGYSPLWIPNLFSGFYLHAEGQVGMFHPAHWLLYRFFPFDAAFALECTLAYPFALAGMFVFLRRLGVARGSALVGATTLGFSTYLMVRFMHVNVVAVLAHTPWLLLCVDLCARAPAATTRRHAWAALALLVASQVLLGYPGAFVASAFCLGLYAIFVARDTQRFAALGALASAACVGVLIASVQWIPTMELFLESNRLDTPFAMLSAQSLHPFNLLQPLAPYLFAERVYQVDTSNPIEQSFYLGAVAPIAVAWLILRRREIERRALLLGLALVVAVSLVLALGRYGGLYWLVAQVPWLGQLRNPARFTLFIHVAVAIGVALAFADASRALRAADARSLRHARALWWIPALATAIAGAALCVGLVSAPSDATATRVSRPLSLLLGPPLFAVATALWLRAARGGALATAALVFFIAADQAAFAASLWWTEPPVGVARFAADTPRGPRGEHGRIAVGYTDYVSVDARGNVSFHASTRRLLHGEHLVWGWTGLMPRRELPPYVPKAGNSEAQAYSPRAIRLAAVTHIRKGKDLVGIPKPLPRFRFVDRVQVSDDVAADVAKIDIATTALVAAPLEPELEPGEPGSVDVLRDRPGEIELTVETPSRQLLVIAESFHPGWQLAIDGQPATLVRAFGDFMGAPVAAGSHRVELEFRPRSLTLGLAGSSIGLLLLACRYLPLRAVRRHFPSPAPRG